MIWMSSNGGAAMIPENKGPLEALLTPHCGTNRHAAPVIQCACPVWKKLAAQWLRCVRLKGKKEMRKPITTTNEDSYLSRPLCVSECGLLCCSYTSMSAEDVILGLFIRG